jgi:hypothetical protein
MVAVKIKAWFAVRAKERMLAGIKANPKERVPEGVETGQARDLAARAVGVSGSHVDRCLSTNEKARTRRAQGARGAPTLAASSPGASPA